MEKVFEEYRKLAGEIEKKCKEMLFDLYDRCGHQIVRVNDVKFHIDTTGKFGDSFTVLLQGKTFCSAHLEAVQRAIKEVLGKKYDLDFIVSYDERAEPIEEEKLKIKIWFIK